MNEGNWQRKKRNRMAVLLAGACLAGALTGCRTVAIYQDPVSKFRAAVNSANDAIRPYLLDVNDLVAKANLYDKVLTGKAWGTEDLKAGIPEEELQVRLQALSTIASYANALGAVAGAKDVDQLQQAASTLGDDVNALSGTIQSVAVRRGRLTGANPVAKQAAALDLGAPVSSLVTLVGTLAIEHKQKAAVEAAILKGDKPIGQIIDLLKTDLRALTWVDDSSYAVIQTGMVKLYNDARDKTNPKDLANLIDQFVRENGRIQALRAIQVDSLLSDMKSAHAALVTFAKSDKNPKDISDLAAQIDVFTAHVQLFNNAIASIQSAVPSSK